MSRNNGQRLPSQAERLTLIFDEQMFRELVVSKRLREMSRDAKMSDAEITAYSEGVIDGLTAMAKCFASTANELATIIETLREPTRRSASKRSDEKMARELIRLRDEEKPMPSFGTIARKLFEANPKWGRKMADGSYKPKTYHQLKQLYYKWKKNLAAVAEWQQWQGKWATFLEWARDPRSLMMPPANISTPS